MFNRIRKLVDMKKTKSICVLAPNKYGEDAGMKLAWVFDLDRDHLPIFHSESEKAKWEMATGEYGCLFDKFITEV